MSSPFALKFLGKKPFTKKTVNPESGGKDYEAMGDAARKREQKLSAESGGNDYEARLKVQKEMSPLKGAYSSGAGGSVYVSTAGAFQNLQDKRIAFRLYCHVSPDKLLIHYLELYCI